VILYLDTSSLVKLYVAEKDSEEIRTLVRGALAVATSAVAYVEAKAAFIRKVREGRIDEEGRKQIFEDFQKDWETYLTIRVSEALIRRAGDLVDKHILRALDAVHLASACMLRERTEHPVVFSSADERLAKAAASEAFKFSP